MGNKTYSGIELKSNEELVNAADMMAKEYETNPDLYK